MARSDSVVLTISPNSRSLHATASVISTMTKQYRRAAM